MTENELATLILDAAFKVHTTLGPGLLERVYEEALAYELHTMGLSVRKQQPIPVTYREVRLDMGYRADHIVEGRIIVEIKSEEAVPRVANKVLLTYLRLADKRLGLLLNFREEHLKDGIKRVVNGLK
jgi:GxxExxY protein